MGLGYSFDIVDGLAPRFQIIPFTYAEQDQWYNPYDGNTYNIPDQLNLVNTPKFVGIDSEYFFRKFTEYQKERSYSIGVDVGITGIVSVAFSHAQGKMEYEMRDLHKAASLVKRDFSLYQLSLWPDEGPNKHFKRAVDALPADYQADAYIAFIQTWGTHYVDVIGLGGSFNISTFINENLVNKKSESWTKNEISISLTYQFISLGLKYANAQNNKKNDEEFLKNAEVKMGAIGGNVLLLESKNYNAWVDSIASNPGPMKFHAAEISQCIIALGGSYSTKQANVKRAVKEYIAKQASRGRHLNDVTFNGVPVEISF